MIDDYFTLDTEQFRILSQHHNTVIIGREKAMVDFEQKDHI